MTATTTVPYDTMSISSRLEPLFSKCCCCVPLRTGCFILGYMNLFYNTLHALGMLTLTTYLGIATHGFDYFDIDPPAVSSQSPEVESVEKLFLHQIGLLLMVILCANVAGMCINIACLVGLHKNRPGPIRIYVAFVTARLLLSLAGFVYLVMTYTTSMNAVISHSIDIGKHSAFISSVEVAGYLISSCRNTILTSHFVIVYYACAKQMERNQQKDLETSEPAVAENIEYIIPPISKLDKESLVA